MSLFPVFIASTTRSTTISIEGPVPRGFILLIASESEDITTTAVEKIIQPVIYSTTLLKILETVTTVSVLAFTLFLLIVLITGTRRFTVPFFKILTVLVITVVIRSIVSIVLKLPTLWFGVMIAHQNIVTLMFDMVSKRLLILLMFLMALNRFLIIFYPKLDRLLFTGYRYMVLCLVCFAISTAESYVIIEASKMRREFVPEIGFMDFVDIARPYEIGCLVFLAIAFVSVILHLTIIAYLRCFNQTTSTKTAKASYIHIDQGTTLLITSVQMQQRMFREVSVMTVVNTLFFLLFIILYHLPSSYESRMIIISIYNILCFAPDIVIPVCILIGSREVHAEISSRFSTVTKIKAQSSQSTKSARILFA